MIQGEDSVRRLKGSNVHEEVCHTLLDFKRGRFS